MRRRTVVARGKGTPPAPDMIDLWRPVDRRRRGTPRTAAGPRGDTALFESLTARFDGVFDRIRGRGRLSERDVDEALAEVRIALLEADVNTEVVRSLLGRIRRKERWGQRCSGAFPPAIRW